MRKKLCFIKYEYLNVISEYLGGKLGAGLGRHV